MEIKFLQQYFYYAIFLGLGDMSRKIKEKSAYSFKLTLFSEYIN